MNVTPTHLLQDDESSYVEDDAASGHPGALLSREAEDDRLARLYEQAGVSKVGRGGGEGGGHGGGGAGWGGGGGGQEKSG